MTNYIPSPLALEDEDDVRADARAEMFFVLQEAFKKRNSECGLKSTELSQLLNKNKGYVSRVLNGSQGSIDYETLCVFMHVLGYSVPLKPVSFEESTCLKANFDAKPSRHRFVMQQSAQISSVKQVKRPTSNHQTDKSKIISKGFIRNDASRMESVS